MKPETGQGLPDRYGQIRSSAAEREHTIDVLKTAFAEGRLTQEEYEDRVGLALHPLTYAELAALTSDLPAGQPASLRPPSSYRSTSASRPLNRTAIASLVCALVLPAVPLLAVLLGLIAHGQIQQRGERGAGLATAGMVIGAVFGLVFIFYVLHH
ncbi:MAG TPA: DUF1707 and DUF4190 domain-containing protein [Streptosporangiaceae bacterium]|nr:DUF1707 and DUF4190 domain-containing protein [Streptosporangiaceae bacterium]